MTRAGCRSDGEVQAETEQAPCRSRPGSVRGGLVEDDRQADDLAVAVLSPQVGRLTRQNTSTDQRPQASTCSRGHYLPLNLPLSLILFW
jgi:hypothetical protein